MGAGSALLVATTAFGASAMYSEPAKADCDHVTHQLILNTRASGINPTATTPQTIWVRFWIYNNDTRSYPLKFYSDGSTAYRSFSYTPVSTVLIQNLFYQSTFTETANLSWRFTLPKGRYSVWAQFAWMTTSGQVNSPVWQTTQFKPYAYDAYTNNTYCYI
jgi:hypothetical protein